MGKNGFITTFPARTLLRQLITIFLFYFSSSKVAFQHKPGETEITPVSGLIDAYIQSHPLICFALVIVNLK